jgi:hypothetical protein
MSKKPKRFKYKLRPAHKERPMTHIPETDATTVPEFVIEIKAAWQKSVDGIIESAVAVLRASKKLDKATFDKMIQEDLPFTASTARRLILIAEHPVLCSHVNRSALPNSWGTLYQLSKVRPPEALQALIEDGTIHARMERKDAERLTKGSEGRSDDKEQKEKCPFCSETNEREPDQPSDSEAQDEQPESYDAMDKLAEQVNAILASEYTRRGIKRSSLRAKIDHVIDIRDRMHPQSLGLLADSLRARIEVFSMLAYALINSIDPDRSEEFQEGLENAEPLMRRTYNPTPDEKREDQEREERKREEWERKQREEAERENPRRRRREEPRPGFGA